MVVRNGVANWANTMSQVASRKLDEKKSLLLNVMTLVIVDHFGLS